MKDFLLASQSQGLLLKSAVRAAGGSYAAQVNRVHLGESWLRDFGRRLGLQVGAVLGHSWCLCSHGVKEKGGEAIPPSPQGFSACCELKLTSPLLVSRESHPLPTSARPCFPEWLCWLGRR